MTQRTSVGIFDHEILFKDSPDTCLCKGSRMVINDNMVLFYVYKDKGYVCTDFYPLMHIQRVRRLPAS